MNWGSSCSAWHSVPTIPTLLLEAHLALGNTSFIRGEFLPARAHFEHSIALYDPCSTVPMPFSTGGTPGSFLPWPLAMTLWFLGYPDQALKTVTGSLTLAQECLTSYSLAAFIACCLDLFPPSGGAGGPRARRGGKAPLY